LIQSRAIKLDLGLKTAYRVILRGKFKSDSDKQAVLLVLGSLDGEHWEPIGAYEKSLTGGGFHDIGCVTDRVSCKYLMVVFAGELSTDSHIDYINITTNRKYNNKLK
jgi:hypothetical protein